MPLELDTAMGPVISEASLQRILDMVDRAVSSGSGRLLSGGSRLNGELAGGYFIGPTILADVDPGAEIAQNEVFGPVLSILSFDDEDEAIRLANATPWGLAAFLHTNDLSTAHRVAGRLDAGYVSINGFAGLTPSAPFGGVKDSGYGREGGRYGIEEFLRPKNVFVAM
jgi:aldehyde dehydrogenase (NAD+)